MIYLAIAIVLLGFFLSNKLPVIKVVDDDPRTWGRNARNNLYRVEISRRIDTSTQSWVGVLAQEVYESRVRWKYLIVLTMFKSVKREMEIVGHAIEAYVAYKFDEFDLNEYLRREARTMQSGYDGLFSEYEYEDLCLELAASVPAAMFWYDTNFKLLDEWHRRWREGTL